jgi:hypothetical protein
MKSRRLTIFCVAMIALAGTPRVWREVGKLLTVVQYKAQVKFWSMVLQPGERQSAGAEMIAAAYPQESSSAEVAANCPTQRRESREHQASNGSKANRRMIPSSVQSQARALEETEDAPASHAGLIARALKAPRGDSNAESLLRSRNAWEHQASAIAGNNPASLVLTSAATLPHQPASKGDTFMFVMPVPAPAAASTLAEKEAIIQFKLMRKSLEGSKLLRQKGRFPSSSGITSFRAS